jgi:hypothetical protein
MKDSSAYNLDDMETVAHPVSEEAPVAASTGAAPATPVPATSDLQSATEAVWRALDSDRYDWRSVDGLAEETKLDKLAVFTILETQLSNAVVRAVDKNQPGRFLYATRDRYNKVRGPWNRVLSVITNQVK